MTKYEYDLKRQKLEIINVLVSRISKWGPLCVIAYFIYLAIAALAGKTTLAQFGTWAIADLRLNKYVSHVVMAAFGLGGISYGALERRLRRKTIKRLGDQNKRLEEKIDRNRSSSRLTNEGKTRPEDRI